MPHNEGIDACRHFLNTRDRNAPSISTETLCDLICMILTMSNFSFNSKHYLQTHGAAMGTRMAPSYANLLLPKFETDALTRASFQPFIWWRYMDDIFMIWTRSVQDLNTFTSFLNDIHPTIFINMFAPKWTRGPHNLTFSLLGPLHYPWVLSVVFKCFANIRIIFQIAFLCVHAERAYILAFFVCHSGFRRWAWPRLLTLSFLMFWKPFARLWYLLRVTFYSVSRFQTGFHGGYHSPFHFIASVASSCFIAHVAFSCYNMCRLHVGFSRRVSPSS